MNFFVSVTQSLEEGPYTLSDKELRRYKIQLCIGKKATVPGQPGKGFVRWIGYLDGEQYLSVGYEMVSSDVQICARQKLP